MLTNPKCSHSAIHTYMYSSHAQAHTQIHLSSVTPGRPSGCITDWMDCTLDLTPGECSKFLVVLLPSNATVDTIMYISIFYVCEAFQHDSIRLPLMYMYNYESLVVCFIPFLTLALPCSLTSSPSSSCWNATWFECWMYISSSLVVCLSPLHV